MTSLLSHKCERCECGVDSRHPARSDGRARASLAARRSAPPGTIRIGTSTHYCDEDVSNTADKNKSSE